MASTLVGFCWSGFRVQGHVYMYVCTSVFVTLIKGLMNKRQTKWNGGDLFGTQGRELEVGLGISQTNADSQ